MQLVCHTTEQLLGGTELHAAQAVRIVHRLPHKPAPEHGLNLRGRFIVMIPEALFQLLLNEFDVVESRRKSTPPSLNGYCGFPSIVHLPLTTPPPIVLDTLCSPKLLVVEYQQGGPRALYEYSWFCGPFRLTLTAWRS